MLTLADLGWGISLAVTVAPLVAVAVATVVIAIAHVLHLAVAVGAPGPLTVAALVVALTAVVLAGREGLALAAGRSAAAAGRALTACSTLAAVTAVASLATLTALTTGAVTTGVEAPRCGGRGSCPLHLVCQNRSSSQDGAPGRTSIFNKSSRPMRLLCISWYASSASRRLSYSTKANLGS